MFTVYNRLGQIIFNTNAEGSGWDGNLKGLKQELGTYVWVCTYQLKGEELKTKTGTVTLLR
jgi:gliding motility-associated-like protein